MLNFIRTMVPNVYSDNAVRTLSSGIYTNHVFTEDGKEITVVTFGNSTDENGNVTIYTYDDQNRVTGVSRKNGNETISNSISYDMGAYSGSVVKIKI